MSALLIMADAIPRFLRTRNSRVSQQSGEVLVHPLQCRSTPLLPSPAWARGRMTSMTSSQREWSCFGNGQKSILDALLSYLTTRTGQSRARTRQQAHQQQFQLHLTHLRIPIVNLTTHCRISVCHQP